VATGNAGRPINIRTGYSKPLLSPDGRTLIIAGERNLGIDLFELATGKKRLHIPLEVSSGDELTYTNALDLWVHTALSPDGRLLFVSSRGGRRTDLDEAFRGYDVGSSQLIFKQSGHRGAVGAFAVTRDGRMLATAGFDSTILIWDLEALRRQQPKMEGETKDTAALWADLADDDAAKAYRAIIQLSAQPAGALKHASKQLRSAASPTPERLAALLTDLESAQFAVREQATKALESFGDLVEPALRKALNKSPSADGRDRIERILAKLEDHTKGQALRHLRAVELLERIDTPESLQLLKTLADGASGALLTREAQAALKRRAVPSR
jgi:hypothetical protein